MTRVVVLRQGTCSGQCHKARGNRDRSEKRSHASELLNNGSRYACIGITRTRLVLLWFNSDAKLLNPNTHPQEHQPAAGDPAMTGRINA
jgi:hypothetical protein